MNIFLSPTTEIHLVLKADYSAKFKKFEFEVVNSKSENMTGISYKDFDSNIVTTRSSYSSE